MLICTGCGEVVERSNVMGCHATIEDTCYNCMKARRWNTSPVMTFEGTFIHEIRNPINLRMDYDRWSRTYGGNHA